MFSSKWKLCLIPENKGRFLARMLPYPRKHSCVGKLQSGYLRCSRLFSDVRVHIILGLNFRPHTTVLWLLVSSSWALAVTFICIHPIYPSDPHISTSIVLITLLIITSLSQIAYKDSCSIFFFPTVNLLFVRYLVVYTILNCCIYVLCKINLETEQVFFYNYFKTWMLLWGGENPLSYGIVLMLKRSFFSSNCFIGFSVLQRTRWQYDWGHSL